MKSYAQLEQDLWALKNTDQKHNGYFVDFGATNGKDINNTFLLEKEFNWTGIVCEPNPVYHKDLHLNRHCKIDTRCVYSVSNSLVPFLNVTEFGELSGISKHAFKDEHSQKRIKSTTILVETVSLEDLLKQHNAPKYIDYMSIDTEGSEFEIISAFDFSKYDIKLITIEHNWTADRENIFNFLKERGYNRVDEHLSRWDDWYIKG